jgi:PAS domain S-box-containing protein
MTEFNKVISGLQSGISRRLILYILLFSMVITFIGTGLQLYLDFNRGIKSIHTTFNQVESSYLHSIINSLWITDNELLQLQLEGILRLPDMQFVEVRKGADVLQAAGTPQSESIIEHNIPLVYAYNGKDVHLGDMHIVASLKGVYSRIFNRILIILSMQTINIFLVSLFIFIIFYQLVGKHIISMASFAESMRFDSTDQMFQLDRKLKTKNPDELEQLVTSFNSMRQKLARDINRREIVEKTLQESEQNLIKGQEIAQMGYWKLNPGSGEIEGSDELLRIFELGKDKMDLNAFADRVHPEDREYDLEHIQIGIEQGVPWDIEHRLLLKDGSVKWVRAIGEPSQDANGNTTQIIGIVQDITERKQAEESLHKFEHIVSSSTDMLAFLDKQYIYLAANKAYIKAFDLTTEKLIGKTVGEVFGNEFFNSVIKTHADLCLAGEEVNYQDWFDFPSIGKCYMDITYYPYYAGDKQILGFVVNGRNITERKLSEERVKISEQRSLAYLENSPACTKIVDLDFNLQFMSEAGIKGLHIDNIEEYYGKPYPFYFYPDSFKVPMTRNLNKAKESDEIITQEAPVVDVDGNEIWFHSTIVPVKDDNGLLEYLMIVSIDTTERKQAEQALNQSEKRFDLAMSASKDGLFDWDLVTNEIYYSPVWKSMLGYEDNELPNDFSVWEELIEPEDAKASWKMQHELINKQRDQFELEFKMRHKDRHWVDILSRAKAIFDDTGKAIRIVGTHIDITGRKQAEQALRESNEKYLNLMDSLGTGVVLHAPDTSIILSNPKASEILGISLEQMKGKKAVDPQWRFVKNDGTDLPIDEYPVNKALRLMEPFSEYFIGIKRPDREYITWVNVNASLVLAENNNTKYVTISFNDTTEQKQAEQALKQSEEKLNLIINASPIGICTVDTLGNISTTNQAYERMVGYSKDECRSLSFFDVTHPNDRPKNKELFQSMFSLDAIGFSMKKRYVRKDGSEIDVAVHAIGIMDAEGNVRFGTAFVDDITDRKRAEEALRESEEKLNALFTSLTEMIVMHELVLNAAGEAIDYRIIDCNKVFSEVTGIPKEDAIGKLASEVYQTDPPPYMEKYAKVALGGGPHEFTTFYPPLSKHFMISVVSPQTGLFATITTDITAMMQIQEMIMAKNKEMENYLYVTSHDLRTPLVNIQGFSQRLKKQADSIKPLFTDETIEPEILHQLAIITDEDIPKTLSFVLSNIEKMDTLINGLLQLSRTGTVELNIQKIDMNALFKKILQSLDFQIKEAQCDIHIDSLPGCYGDAALLDQLFANIISNALNHSDSKRALEITVTAKHLFNTVVYSIRDTGKGIEQKHLDKIWDVFYRIDRRSGKTGEGIGLSLVKRIVEKHKGKVWAESEENKGSVFYIELQKCSFTEF